MKYPCAWFLRTAGGRNQIMKGMKLPNIQSDEAKLGLWIGTQTKFSELGKHAQTTFRWSRAASALQV